MEGRGTPASMERSTVQRPSPESSTYGESAESFGSFSRARSARSRSHGPAPESTPAPSDHGAVPRGKPPDPTARPGVEEPDPSPGKQLRPAGRFLVKRVPAVPHRLPRLEAPRA